MRLPIGPASTGDGLSTLSTALRQVLGVERVASLFCRPTGQACVRGGGSSFRTSLPITSGSSSPDELASLYDRSNPVWALHVQVPVLALSRSGNRYAPLARLFNACSIRTLTSFDKGASPTFCSSIVSPIAWQFNRNRAAHFVPVRARARVRAGASRTGLSSNCAEMRASGYRRKPSRARRTYTIDIMPLESMRFPSAQRDGSSGLNPSPAHEWNAPVKCFQFGSVKFAKPIKQSNIYQPICCIRSSIIAL